MGLSSLPSPSEGMMCVILVNTAISISIVKGIVRWLLHVVGIRVPEYLLEAEEPEPPLPEPYELNAGPSELYIEEFRSRTPAARFEEVFSCRQRGSGDNKDGECDSDCSVCLNEFEPESEINRLDCGHVFHKACLEKWLDYWNTTCPLCRTPFIPFEESCFW